MDVGAVTDRLIIENEIRVSRRDTPYQESIKQLIEKSSDYFIKGDQESLSKITPSARLNMRKYLIDHPEFATPEAKNMRIYLNVNVTKIDMYI